MLLFVSNAPPTTEIYTLSLHDALPISPVQRIGLVIDRKILRLLPKRVIKPRPEWIAPAVCMNPQPNPKSRPAAIIRPQRRQNQLHITVRRDRLAAKRMALARRINRRALGPD